MASDHDIDMDALHYGFHAAIEQYAVECERALAELDAELGARRRQAVRALAARAAARLTASQGGGWKPGGELGAVRPSIKPVVGPGGRAWPCAAPTHALSVFDMGSPCASRDAASSDAGQAATLSTLKHGCTRVLCASAAGSPHLVQTVLDDGRSFLTLEPPCMTSPRLQASPPAAAPRPPVPPLDMTKVVMGSPGMASSFGCEGAVLEAADGPLFGLPEDATSDASQEGSTRASSAASRARRKAPPVAGGGGAAGRASASASGAAFGLGCAGGGGHARSAGHVLEVGMAVLVLASAAALGLESSHAARGLEAPPGLLAVEVAFLAACAAELAVRSTMHRDSSTADNWRVFDIFVLTYGIVYVVLAAALQHRPGAQGALRLARAPRWLRLLRLWRAAGRCPAPQRLRLVAAGALAPALWLMAAAVVGLYAYAALGMELIPLGPEYGEEYEAVAELHFRTLGDAILALLSVATLEGVLPICVPLVAARPQLAPYFGLLVAGGSVGAVALLAATVAEALARAPAGARAAGAVHGAGPWLEPRRPEAEAWGGGAAAPEWAAAPGSMGDGRGGLGGTDGTDCWRHPRPGAQCRGDQEAAFSWSPSTLGGEEVPQH